jgi:hypothetical protein
MIDVIIPAILCGIHIAAGIVSLVERKKTVVWYFSFSVYLLFVAIKNSYYIN